MDTRINQERKENFIAILYSTKTFQEDHFLTLIFFHANVLLYFKARFIS